MFVAVLALAPGAAAQERAPGLVTMTGYGAVQSTPDRAWVSVGIEARAVQVKAAQQKAAEAMAAIQQRLKALGIPENAVRTSSFNVQQDWAYVQGRRNLRGYVVSNQIEVKVDDITTVPAVLDGSIAAGANMIHGIRWDMQDRQALERQALQRAFEDARGRAQAIAVASGVRLGGVHAVHESRAGQARPMAYVGNAVAEQSLQAADTPISPGEIDIRATVTVSFLIQGAAAGRE
jgi:hypothetical protein